MAKTLTDQEKKEILERFAKEKQACFYSAGNATENLAKFAGVKSASNWIKPLYGQSPTEFYSARGLLMNEVQIQQHCDAVFEELKKRYEGKTPAKAFFSIQEENPDLDIGCFKQIKNIDYLQFVKAGIIMHPYPTREKRVAAIQKYLKELIGHEQFVSLYEIRKRIPYSFGCISLGADDSSKCVTWPGMDKELFSWIEEYWNMPLKQFMTEAGILCENRKEIVEKTIRITERYHAKNGGVWNFHEIKEAKVPNAGRKRGSFIVFENDDSLDDEEDDEFLDDEDDLFLDEENDDLLDDIFDLDDDFDSSESPEKKNTVPVKKKNATSTRKKNAVSLTFTSKDFNVFKDKMGSIKELEGGDYFGYFVDEGEELGLSEEQACERARQVLINKGILNGEKKDVVSTKMKADNNKGATPSVNENKVQESKKVNIYRLPDEVVRKLLIGDKDPIEAIDNRKFPRKMVIEVETEQGTVSVTNQAHTDIKRNYNGLSSWESYYDMYVAEENYLTKEEMAERIQIVDKGHTDTSYYAEPEIDWIAEALTKEQIATRILLLATVADKLLTSDYIKEIIASMPRTKKGDLMKNRVTRIASGNIVTKEAKVLELVARAKTESNVIISAEFRSFSAEELETLENDFLSSHISALGWETIPEVPKQEKTEQPKSQITKVTIYKPESFAWEKAQYNRGLASKRYDGVTVRFDIVWDTVRKNGYSYKNAVDEAEKIMASYSCYVWAPFNCYHSFPWEKPHDDDPVRLGEIIVDGIAARNNEFPDWMNHFFFTIDMICLKDAIRKHDLALLQARTKFLSPENIDECIRFAKEEKAEDCAAWLIHEKE